MSGSTARAGGWREALRPYFEKESLAAFFVGISSGFPYALIAATLTTRLAQDGIRKSTITAFSLAFLVYNLKFLWAPMVDRVHLPGLARFGQRRSWLWFCAAAVAASIIFLGLVSPKANLQTVALAAVLVGIAGSTFDIVIDAYRIELLTPRQLGVGSGMSQYGWRIGSVCAGALALLLSASFGWSTAYMACAVFAIPAVFVGFWLGEPLRHREPVALKGLGTMMSSVTGPLTDFFRRQGAWLVLVFVLIHKIGDTLANLTLRLLLQDMHFSNEEIATYDVGFGFIAYLVGIFIGGALYVRLGMKRAVLLSLVLMAISNLSFAILAHLGHDNAMLAFANGFESVSSGIGGVVVVAYLSALCNLSYTASQYALLSAAASVVGRLITGTTAGALIQSMGYVNFYLMTTVVALPGVFLFAWMMHRGLVDQAIAETDVRAAA